MNTHMNENEIRSGYSLFTKSLIEKGLTVTVMESATAGLIASLITDTEGSSAVFRGSFVAYSNDAKIRFGVPKEITEKYSVYSKETALAMADACRSYFDSDIGIGITGTMGNIDPENADASIPGKIYFAIKDNDFENAYAADLPMMESRYEFKLAAAREILSRLL